MAWSGPGEAAISHYSCTSSTITELTVIYLKYLRNECGSIVLGFVATETSLMSRSLYCISSINLLCIQVSFVQWNACIHAVSI